MANTWLRLWHDMPNDPKWRTISRSARQPLALVQAVYLHLLVDASRNVTRGVTSVTTEDLASALDADEDQIEAILTAMQGRVLDGCNLSGWNNRQPAREDLGDPQTGAKSAAQRKREQRERERNTGSNNEGHEASRSVTPDKDTDTDTDTEGAKAPTPVAPKTKPAKTDSKTDPRFEQFWRVYPNRKAKAKAETAWLKLNPSNELFETLMAALAAQSLSPDWVKDEGQFVPHPATWINQRRWEDEVNHASSPQPGRSGTVSEVDKVRLAIEAREAAAATAGQAVAENGRDLRPALDGEFRRVG